MRSLAALCLCLSAAPLGAHPHIFINAGLTTVIDAQNRLTHVQVTWEYDELYSLLVTEDMQIDSDYDGVLTADDMARLTGFDMQWIEGFNGDLEGMLGGVPLVLSQPTEPTASFVDGKIITTHRRAVQGAPLLDGPLLWRPYDITYYTAYDVTLPVSVQGREDCDIGVEVPDIAGGLALLQAEVAALPEDYDMEALGFGDIGTKFATDIIITCAAR